MQRDDVPHLSKPNSSFMTLGAIYTDREINNLKHGIAT